MFQNSPKYDNFLGGRGGYDRDSLVDYWAPHLSKRRESIGHLFQIQRAVSQFVTIGTNGIIPGRDVNYKLIGDSYIDYDRKVNIRIHSDATIMVGLALHEASHCAWSSMEVFKSLADWMKKPANGLENKSLFPKGFEEFINKFATKFGLNLRAAVKEFFSYVNWLEDRRIDKIRVSSCPGYAGYYDSLYNEYFWRPEDSELLTGKNFRQETIRSYGFRIFTMLHPDFDHSALKRLPEITELIDLDNILRLGKDESGTKLIAQMAFDIWNILFDACDELKNDEEVSHQMSNSGGQGQPGNIGGDPNDTDDNEEDEDEKRRKNLQRIMNDFLEQPLESGDIESALDSLLDDLSDPNSGAGKEMTAAEKSLDSKKSFLNDDQLTETLYAISDKELAAIQAMIASSVKVSEVFKGSYHAALFEDIDKVQGLTVGFLSDSPARCSSIVDDAIRQGRQLGHRYRKDMTILNETKTKKTIRKKNGRIDNRILYAADFDSMIYASTRKTKRQRVYLHLSLDASGSMDTRSRWAEAVKLATMLVYATNGINGFILTISIRSNYGTAGSNDDPALAIVYDSRKHTTRKFEKNIRRITLNSSTPESLLYELASKFMHKNVPADCVKYFVTVTDGEPCFHGYSGKTAVAHCTKEIRTMNKQGIEVFGYFVGSSDSNDTYKTFREMYGDNSAVLGDSRWGQIANDLKRFILYNNKVITI